MRRSWTRAKNRGAIRILVSCRSPLAVTADKAYVSEQVRQRIKDEGVLPVIPNRSNTAKKAYNPKRFYRRRHTIENYFCRIEDFANPLRHRQKLPCCNHRRRRSLPDQTVSPDPNLSLLAY
jgi:hypothetical protein